MPAANRLFRCAVGGSCNGCSRRRSRPTIHVAVATVSLAHDDRLTQELAALQAEPIPWRRPDLTRTNLATLLAARLGERMLLTSRYGPLRYSGMAHLSEPVD